MISIVDRFLEHSRIFYFENGGNGEVYLGSADWMPRNFFRRIEVMFPVEDPRLRARIVEEILPIILADNVKARQLLPDGNYVRLNPAEGAAPVRSQLVLQHVARESSRDAGDKPFQFIPIIRQTPTLFDSLNGPPSSEREAPRSAQIP